MEPIQPILPIPAWWATLNTVTWLLFLVVFLAAAGAFTLALAHAIVPSLTATRQAPSQLISIRPMVYGLSAILLILAAFALYLATVQAYEVLLPIYNSIWM